MKNRSDFLRFIFTLQDESDDSNDEDWSEKDQANIDVLEYLLKLGAHVNLFDFYNLTALHHAAMRGNSRCVKILIEQEGIALEVCGISDYL